MTDYSIKNKIMSLKNKLFSFFKIKDKSKNIVNANTNANNKNELNKITYDYSSIETKMNIETEDKKIINHNLELDSHNNDQSMIHASFVVNNIIDKIVTSTYGSCDKKTYITDISDFYINNLDYSSFQNTMTSMKFYEFAKYIEAVLNRNIDIMYNLRSIKLYDNDLSYCSLRAGVFKTDNFIIKIDTDSFNFKNEIVGMYNLGKGLIEEHSIVLPYYAHFSSKKKKNTSFSIQPRIHNTISLRDWMLIYANQRVDIEIYIRMCICISKSIQFINSKHLVHGDIKPDNIIIEYTTNRPYIIDFGLCGLHDLSEGTGGTKPFCHPETDNTNDNYKDSTEYNWVKNTKNNDLWSISFIFATILIFRKCYIYYKDYPADFFNDEKYVSINYLNYIPDKFRAPFVYVLTKESSDTRIDIQSFISLLEMAL
jgi:serine/threonine protein kinase